MNHYSRAANFGILAIIVLGALIALPNLYTKEPAIQVAARDSKPIDADTTANIKGALAEAKLVAEEDFIEGGRLMLLYGNSENQLAAKEIIDQVLDEQHVSALTLESKMPAWMRAIGLRPMSLGLDLRGGVHFLFEVDMAEAQKRDMQTFSASIKQFLRDKEIRYQQVTPKLTDITLAFSDFETRDKARKELIDEFGGTLTFETPESTDSPPLRAYMSEDQLKARRDFAIDQNMTTLRNRVDELGVVEPIVQRQGLDRLLVQLPGVQDPAQAERILGATATLEFRLVNDSDPMLAESSGHTPLGTELHHFRDGTSILLEREVIVTGDSLTDASAGFDQQTASPAVYVRLDAKGAHRMLETTKRNVGRRMAVVFIEQNRESKMVDGVEQERTVVKENVINAATIQGVFGASFQITGLDNIAESSDLALLLRAGALATPIYKVEERTIGPSLGQDNIDRGFRATVIGFIAVVIFMLAYYRMFGIFANVALLVNVVLIIALLSLFQAALTMPGIAGILLTVGMAVDANVLINERIREELRNGNTPQASIQAGYDKAFSAIADSNITTLIAALVLFVFGTGPIRGFAVTLSIGILTSMFTAVIITRFLVNLVYGGKKITKLAV